MKKYIIVKCNNKYFVNLGTHEMIYDQNGHYLGQTQPNMVEDGEIFIKAINNGIMFRGTIIPINDLTNSEMNTLKFIGE